MIEPGSPSAHPWHGAILLFPQFRLFFTAHEWILGSWDPRNVGPSDNLEHAQSVRDLLFEPGIARHYRYAQDLRLWRLNQQQDRLLIGSSGTGSILIDDDLALARGGLLSAA